MKDEPEKPNESRPPDDLKWVGQLQKLEAEKSKPVNRVNGAIAIIAGVGFLWYGIAGEMRLIFRAAPLLAAAVFLAMGLVLLVRGGD